MYMFSVWYYRPAFLPVEADLPILQGNITAQGTAKGRAHLTVISCGPSILTSRNTKTQENISDLPPVEVFLLYVKPAT